MRSFVKICFTISNIRRIKTSSFTLIYNLSLIGNITIAYRNLASTHFEGKRPSD
jgi:hypothetical protein